MDNKLKGVFLHWSIEQWCATNAELEKKKQRKTRCWKSCFRLFITVIITPRTTKSMNYLFDCSEFWISRQISHIGWIPIPPSLQPSINVNRSLQHKHLMHSLITARTLGKINTRQRSVFELCVPIWNISTNEIFVMHIETVAATAVGWTCGSFSFSYLSQYSAYSILVELFTMWQYVMRVLFLSQCFCIYFHSNWFDCHFSRGQRKSKRHKFRLSFSVYFLFLLH